MVNQREGREIGGQRKKVKQRKARSNFMVVESRDVSSAN